jgi:hypothetical protein
MPMSDLQPENFGGRQVKQERKLKAGAAASSSVGSFGKQITGNAALHFAAWQLSRRGWHVMATTRNARGSDMFIVNDSENVSYGVQSKAQTGRNDVGLGKSIDNLQSEWWIIIREAKSDNPACYVLRQQEVRDLAVRDKGGERKYWLKAAAFQRDEFREAWHRIGGAGNLVESHVAPVIHGSAPNRLMVSQQTEQYGVRRPKPDTLCGKAWKIFDELSKSSGSPVSVGEALKTATQQGLNGGNVRVEFYRWRKFHNIKR